ncbi:hypothetical protein [Legionella sp. CNM-4043-24]|uniref:hypothetical protein n=1 Tax=Legionella sp. CNM-4043-24 TaxID=3421646 RepID=UPI00403A8D4C
MSITKAKIEELLARYKKHHEGIFRKKIPWATEPHIAELKPFVDALPQGELSPENRVKLAVIVRKKQDRKSDAGSSLTFAPLAMDLGGYEALDMLADNHLLNAGCLNFVQKYPGCGLDIAKFLSTMSKIMSEQLLSELQATFEHCNVDMPGYLMRFYLDSRKTVADYIPLLRMMNKNGIFTDDIIQSWPAISVMTTRHLLELEDALEKLARLNPELNLLQAAMDLSQNHSYSSLLDILSKPLQPTVDKALKALSVWDSKLLTLNNIHLFMQRDMAALKAFSTASLHLPASQTNLYVFMLAPVSVISSSFLPMVLCNFKIIRREVTPFLADILSTSKDYFNLAIALITLKDVPLDDGQFSSVIRLMLNNREQSLALARAVVYSMQEPGSFSADFDLISQFSAHHDQLLMAHKCIQNYGLLTSDAFKICEKNTIFAHGLSQFLVQWHRLYGTEKAPSAAVINKPECAEATAQVLDFLNTEQLTNDTIVNAICDAGPVDGALLSFLRTIKQAGQLNLNNLNSLLPRLWAISTLNEAADCLVRGDVILDQTNYDTLLIEPDNARAMALHLGGKELEPEKPGAEGISTFTAQDFELADHLPEKIHPVTSRAIGHAFPSFFSPVVMGSSMVSLKDPAYPQELLDDPLFSPAF